MPLTQIALKELEVREMTEARKIVPVIDQPQAVMTPMAMIDRAVASGASMETLERLMALQERYEANEAKREYNEAIAAAKAEIKPIIKKKTASFPGKGGEVSYAYEDLADVAELIDPILTSHGLSYRYESKVEGTIVTMTCIPFHRRGHEGAGATLSAGLDTTGAKNPIQSMGSTVSYLQRYTLKLAFGLAAAKDTDGAVQGDGPKLIDAAQFQELRDLIDTHGADETKFLRAIGAETLETLTQSQYKTGKARLLAWVKQKDSK